MSVQYVHPKTGYRFKITAEGKKVKSIEAKFHETSMLYKQYKHSVPKSWVTNGYVEEVKEESEETNV